MDIGKNTEKGTVCVTGAGGFVASWLVKLLLSKNYKVHGTVRDTSDEKNAHLKKLDKASDNLQLFKADLLDYESLLAAIVGCEGVFHTACPVPSCKVANPQKELLEPATTGTLNVLNACLEEKVRRVVVVSSVAAVYINPNWPQDKIMDEDCWSDKEYCKKIENWYCLSKTVAEEEAVRYARGKSLNVVHVLPSLVIGPLLQSRVNASTIFFLNLLKGALEEMEDRVRHFVDVRDVAKALLLAYEKQEVVGRYICTSHSMTVRDFVDCLKRIYPNYKYPISYIEVANRGFVSSAKLKGLGWKCRTMEETIKDSIECFHELCSIGLWSMWSGATISSACTLSCCLFPTSGVSLTTRSPLGSTTTRPTVTCLTS